jgi:hypothetical protein
MGALVLKKSAQHEFRLSRTGFVLSIAFVLLSACFARERGPRVEVVCPSPPIPVTIGKNKVLVYELHLTNFDVVPLTTEAHFNLRRWGKSRSAHYSRRREVIDCDDPHWSANDDVRQFECGQR